MERFMLDRSPERPRPDDSVPRPGIAGKGNGNAAPGSSVAPKGNGNPARQESGYVQLGSSPGNFCR